MVANEEQTSEVLKTSEVSFRHSGKRSLRWRLCLLMFLQYAPAGAMLPLFSLRLKELSFNALEIGWICATQALAALVGPLIAGQVADRWLPPKYCLAAAALVAGGLLWLLAGLTSSLAVFVTSFAFWLTMAPAIMLGTAVTFANLPNPDQDFGRVRLWGTVGWVAAVYALICWFRNPEWLCRIVAHLRPASPHSELADAFRLGGLLAFALSAYALTLPLSPAEGRRVGVRGARPAPIAALRLLRSRPLLLAWISAFGIWMTWPFFTQATPLLLRHLGIELAELSFYLTIAQGVEMLSLAVLPILLLRLGLRGTMLLGLLAMTLGMAIQAAGQPDYLVIASLGLYGLCVSSFLVSCQVFTNSRARGDIRASAQALLSFISGLGMLIGNLLAGFVRQLADERLPPTFLVATLLAAGITLVFFLFFSEEPTADKKPA